MPNTLRYIILLNSFLCLFLSGLYSQDKNTDQSTEEKIPFYNGIKVEVDAFSAVMSAINQESYSFEGNVQVNLKEKYFPVLEMGFAGANKKSINDYGFKTNAPFFRLGFDYNLLAANVPGAPIRKYFFIGGRYGFSGFKYDITNIKIEDDYWGGEPIIRNYENIKTYKQWFEVTANLRVEIFKNVYMGWGARLKILLGKEKEGDLVPWYIPGIGIKSVGNWGFNYSVGYVF